MNKNIIVDFKPVKLDIKPSGYSKIPTDRLEELFEKEAFLDALKACGVDNWDSYQKAYEMYEGT